MSDRNPQKKPAFAKRMGWYSLLTVGIGALAFIQPHPAVNPHCQNPIAAAAPLAADARNSLETRLVHPAPPKSPATLVYLCNNQGQLLLKTTVSYWDQHVRQIERRFHF